jgi:hypothetical protein
MQSINDFKESKLSEKTMNSFFGGSAEEVVTSTMNEKCGDTKKTWYNEDKTICCTETVDICCDAIAQENKLT